MTQVVFYEKPGCGGNGRQRRWLEDAGCTLEVRDLASWPWSAESLMAWLAPLPHADWFNRAAPRIKSGALKPETLDRAAALALLLAEPLLIRRPLIQIGAFRLVGFDTSVLLGMIGSGEVTEPANALEACSAHVCRTRKPEPF